MHRLRVMAIRGQRFRLDLDSDDDEGPIKQQRGIALSSLGVDFVRDISERPSVHPAKPPSAPTLKSSTTGFPAHKKRVNPSAFKQQRIPATTIDGELSRPRASHAFNHEPALTTPSGLGSKASRATRKNGSLNESVKNSIDEENQQRLAQMSPEQIERERAELMAGMSSSLIDRLLKRANIDEGRTDSDKGFDTNSNVDSASPKPRRSSSGAERSSKTVTFDTPDGFPDTLATVPKALEPDLDESLSQPPEDPQPLFCSPAPPNIHFPRPPEAPSLDPSDPNFHQKMHARYFPEFPLDPSKLAWMAPIPTEGSPADQDSPYNPSQDTLTISALRFDFRGRLIPPRLARQIPVTQGLHHHGQAPEAAGYTIPELAHLSRSSVPAQRCISYQTLGRILYRLGRGDFGDESEDLYLGLWKCIEEGRVVDTLAAEANKEDGKGNRSCKVTATEALWLWQKGGGKKWKAQ